MRIIFVKWHKISIKSITIHTVWSWNWCSDNKSKRKLILKSFFVLSPALLKVIYMSLKIWIVEDFLCIKFIFSQRYNKILLQKICIGKNGIVIQNCKVLRFTYLTQIMYNAYFKKMCLYTLFLFFTYPKLNILISSNDTVLFE